MELANNNWISDTKSSSQFFAPTAPPSSSSHDKPPSGSSSSGAPTHDFRGNPIDRTPPAPGQPSERINSLTQRTEYWCNNCPHGGRWGNHSTSHHDSWMQKMKERQQRRKEKKSKSAPPDSSSAPPAGAPPASAPAPAPPSGPLVISGMFTSSSATGSALQHF
jgi:hypothetical protein